MTKAPFFSKEYTTTLKGLCALVVVMVHIPEAWSTPLQDGIGSFAFVAVTLFFLFSSFGLHTRHRQDARYLDRFWPNRLASLLVPVFLVNFCRLAFNGFVHGQWSLLQLLRPDSYVCILLCYCLLFYLFTRFFPASRYGTLHAAAQIILVVLASLLLYFLSPDRNYSALMGWCYEQWGLVWGILLFCFFHRFLAWTDTGWFAKLTASFVISLAAGLLYLRYKEVWFGGQYVLKILLGLSLIVFLFLLTRRGIPHNSITGFLGSISYGIYLSHGLVISALMNFAPQSDSWTFIGLTILLTVVLSLIINKVSQPVIRKIRSL